MGKSPLCELAEAIVTVAHHGMKASPVFCNSISSCVLNADVRR